MRKAGDIIPEVLSVVKKCDNSSVYKMPDKCPSCGSPVTREEGEAVRAAQCRLPRTAFAPPDTLYLARRNGIEGLGPAVLEQLLGAGLIHSIDDIYSIDYEEVKA